MSVSIISESITTDGLCVQMFENSEGKRGVRTYDKDSNENIELKKFPNKRMASLYFIKITEKVG